MELIRRIVVSVVLMTVLADGVLCQWNHTIFVSTNGTLSPSCWEGHGACRTLEYASRGINQSSTRILVLDGLHILSTIVEIADFTEIAFVGLGGNISQVKCLPASSTGAGLHFTTLKGLQLANLTLISCGGLGYSTVQDDTSPNTTLQFRAAVYILNSSDILVHSVAFINGTGIGLSLFDTNGVVSVLSSVFIANTVPHNESTLFSGGGGLYIEHTYCTPGRTTQCDYKANPYVRNSTYDIRNCLFAGNKAIVNYFSFLPEHAEMSRTLGRGGGAAVHLKGCSRNNSFVLFNCTFENNTAPFGGGYNVQFYDSVYNNSFYVSLCKFDNNSADSGGGAFRVGIEFYASESLDRNHIFVLNTNFTNSTAKFGGAVDFFSSRTIIAEHVTNTMTFTNATWIGNSAITGPAVELTPNAWDTLTDGYLPIPVFHHCHFLENSLLTESDGQQVSSSGILFVNTYTVNFTSVTFRRNNGTALYVTAGSINVLPGNVIFDGNEAIQGGAIALMGFSAIRTFPNSTLIFTNNHATDVGGAIYASSIDITDFLYSRNCFIRYVNAAELPERWSTTFYFSNNTAETYGHSIYATSLYPCTRAYMTNTSDPMDVHKTFHGPPFNYSDAYKLYNIASDPSILKLNLSDPTHLRFSPGQIFDLRPVAKDDLNQTVKSVYKASAYQASKHVSIDGSFVYISDGKIRITGPVNSTFQLILQTTGFQKLEISARVTLAVCPPGFVSPHHFQCVCSADTDELYAGISRCDYDHFTALLDKGFWAGCSDSQEESLETSQCPLGYCRDVHSHGSTSPLAMNCSELDAFICGARNRTGTLCGKCQRNLTVLFHSQRYLCSDCKHHYLGWLFYILSELLPLTLLFLVIMAFNVSLTSGVANSFILFAQVMDFFQVDALGNFALPKGISILTDVYQFIFGFFNLDFFRMDALSFCLWNDATVLDMLVIKYVTTAYAMLLLAVMVVALRMCSSNPCAQRFLRSSSIVHGISAFLIMSYAQCAKVSFQLLTRTELQGKGLRPVREVVFLSGTTEFFSTDHLPYAIPAIFVLLTICMVPPILLLAYPTLNKLNSLYGGKEDSLEQTRIVSVMARCCCIHRLKPFFDCFQGCFKDNFRFFAGLYFVYRLAMSAAFAFTDNGIAFYVFLEVVVVCILGLHAACQPYKERLYNFIDALIFTDLAVINGISLYNFYWSQYQASHKDRLVAAASIQVVLIYIPILYTVAIVSLKLACKLRRFRVKLRRVNQYIPLFNEEEYVDDQDEDQFNEEARLFEADELRSSAGLRNRHQRRENYGATDKYRTL